MTCSGPNTRTHLSSRRLYRATDGRTDGRPHTWGAGGGRFWSLMFPPPPPPPPRRLDMFAIRYLCVHRSDVILPIVRFGRRRRRRLGCEIESTHIRSIWCFIHVPTRMPFTYGMAKRTMARSVDVECVEAEGGGTIISDGAVQWMRARSEDCEEAWEGEHCQFDDGHISIEERYSGRVR